MEIQVFGGSSAKSAVLTRHCEFVASLKGGRVGVQKVVNRDALHALKELELPALAINGRIMSTGRIPSPDEIIGWIDEIELPDRTLH